MMLIQSALESCFVTNSHLLYTHLRCLLCRLDTIFDLELKRESATSVKNYAGIAAAEAEGVLKQESLLNGTGLVGNVFQRDLWIRHIIDSR